MELALFSDMLAWPSYRRAWAESGCPEAEWPGLWGLLVREQREDEAGQTRVVEQLASSAGAHGGEWKTEAFGS